jgi:serine/threonine protein kinase
MGRKYGNRWEGVGGNLGQGGQSTVLRVKDVTKELDGEYALKRAGKNARIFRFRTEIEAIKMLRHPNIVRLIDHSAFEDGPSTEETKYLVMPIALGGDLSNAVDRYRGNVERTLSVARQIAEGLQEAHAHRVIHRDIKPKNILPARPDADEIWIADFGICLIRDGRDRGTETGASGADHVHGARA